MYRYYLTYAEDDLVQTEEGIFDNIQEFAEDLDEIEIISLDIRILLTEE